LAAALWGRSLGDFLSHIAGGYALKKISQISPPYRTRQAETPLNHQSFKIGKKFVWFTRYNSTERDETPLNH